MTFRERRLAKRLRRAEDNLADLTEYRYKWGFSMAPSERRSFDERIVKAQTNLDRLSADARPFEPNKPPEPFYFEAE
jgi:hypothetical protein